MIYYCISCGSKIEGYKGNRKYCTSCRCEIECTKNNRIPFKEAARQVCDKHKLERNKSAYLRSLSANKRTINEVVTLALKNGTSYGVQVAKLEGRLH